MKDYTAEAIHLENLYEAMQIAKKRIADEIRARHRVTIRREIEEAQRDLEYTFAQELAKSHANGLPGQVIRTNVLRTQDWGRWKKWRDLAQIKPERVTASNARAEATVAKQGYRYEDGILTMLRNHAGDEMEPMQFDVEKWRENPVGLAPALDMDAFISYGRSFSDPHAFNNHVKKVLNGLTS